MNIITNLFKSYKEDLLLYNCYMLAFLTIVSSNYFEKVNQTLFILLVFHLFLVIFCWWKPGERAFFFNTFIPKLVLDPKECENCGKNFYPWEFKLATKKCKGCSRKKEV